MIQVRFVYQNHLIGEWADAADGVYLYPNPDHRGEITAVQVRENGEPPPAPHGSHARSRDKARQGWRSRPSAVPNGQPA